MNATGSSFFMDSSAWLEYFLRAQPDVTHIIDSGNNTLFTSVISLFEIKRRLLAEKKLLQKIQASLSFIKSRSIIIEINERIAEAAAQDSVEEQLHAIDAIIYRSAIEQRAILLTFDADFKKIKENILFLGK